MTKKDLVLVAKALNEVLELDEEDAIDTDMSPKELEKELKQCIGGKNPELEIMADDDFDDKIWSLLAELGNETAKKKLEKPAATKTRKKVVEPEVVEPEDEEEDEPEEEKEEETTEDEEEDSVETDDEEETTEDEEPIEAPKVEAKTPAKEKKGRRESEGRRKEDTVPASVAPRVPGTVVKIIDILKTEKHTKESFLQEVENQGLSISSARTIFSHAKNEKYYAKYKALPGLMRVTSKGILTFKPEKTK